MGETLFQKGEGSITPHNIGIYVVGSVNGFLYQNESINYNPYTFTELFTFTYFNVDLTFLGTSVEIRRKILESCLSRYEDFLCQKFPIRNIEYHLEQFDRRMSEYGDDYQLKIDPVETFEKLCIYIGKASISETYYQKDDQLPLEFTSTQQRNMVLQEYIINEVFKLGKKLQEYM